MCEKNLPCGYSDFHHTQSYHLGNLRTKLPGRQGVVQKPGVTMYKWCSLTFLPRIMKWPVFFLFMPDTHSLIFYSKIKNHVLVSTTSDLRAGHAVKVMKRASQLLTNGMHLQKRSWGDSCPFGLFPISQTNT